MSPAAGTEGKTKEVNSASFLAPASCGHSRFSHIGQHTGVRTSCRAARRIAPSGLPKLGSAHTGSTPRYCMHWRATKSPLHCHLRPLVERRGTTTCTHRQQGTGVGQYAVLCHTVLCNEPVETSGSSSYTAYANLAAQLSTCANSSTCATSARQGAELRGCDQAIPCNKHGGVRPLSTKEMNASATTMAQAMHMLGPNPNRDAMIVTEHNPALSSLQVWRGCGPRHCTSKIGRPWLAGAVSACSRCCCYCWPCCASGCFDWSTVALHLLAEDQLPYPTCAVLR